MEIIKYLLSIIKKILVKKFKNNYFFDNEVNFLNHLKINNIENFPKILKINFQRKVLKQTYYSNFLKISNQKLFEQNVTFIKDINKKK